MSNKDISITPRNSRDLEVISQELGTKNSQILYYTTVWFSLFLSHFRFVKLLENVHLYLSPNLENIQPCFP